MMKQRQDQDAVAPKGGCEQASPARHPSTAALASKVVENRTNDSALRDTGVTVRRVTTSFQAYG